MYDDLPASYQETRHLARDIGIDVSAKHAPGHDRDLTLPVETFAALFEAGLLNACIPTEFGGLGSGAFMGSDTMRYLLIIEELARSDMSAAHCFQVHAHTCQLLSFAGTRSQNSRWFEASVDAGEILAWASGEHSRTQRGQFNLVSTATPTGEGYVLNGLKTYGTNSSLAVWNVMGFAVTGIDAPDNYLLALAPRDTPGITIDEKGWVPLGMRSALSPDLQVDNVPVLHCDVLQGPGFWPRSKLGACLHLGFTASHIGAAQGLVDYMMVFLPKRGNVGSPHVQRVIGEMTVKLCAARALLLNAARLWDKKIAKEAAEQSLIAKLFAITTAEWILGETVRLVGSGAMGHEVVSRMIRDIHVHSTHANIDNTAQLIGRAQFGLSFDSTQQQ